MIHIRLQKQLSAAEGDMLLKVDCMMKPGQLYVIYGVSGAGKTSILRMMAGLLQPEAGYIEVNGQIWLDTSQKINLKPQQRNIGFVFQDYALFPNMTVRQNLVYALGKSDNPSVVDELIEMTQLSGLQNRKPGMLSGGQQQRVALARALVRQPDILMLDEPLSALDEGMRARLQDYILKLHKKYGLTTILVSHDMGEIIKMADHIFVLKNGKITQQGSPLKLFSSTQVSGKYRAIGTVLQILPNETTHIISIWVGNHVVKVIATEEEITDIQEGDKVMVVSKAFNPIIMKI